MSRPIRRLIWPTKSRLVQYIKSANGLLEKKPIETEAEDFANRILSNIVLKRIER